MRCHDVLQMLGLDGYLSTPKLAGTSASGEGGWVSGRGGSKVLPMCLLGSLEPLLLWTQCYSAPNAPKLHIESSMKSSALHLWPWGWPQPACPASLLTLPCCHTPVSPQGLGCLRHFPLTCLRLALLQLEVLGAVHTHPRQAHCFRMWDHLPALLLPLTLTCEIVGARVPRRRWRCVQKSQELQGWTDVTENLYQPCALGNWALHFPFPFLYNGG